VDRLVDETVNTAVYLSHLKQDPPDRLLFIYGLLADSKADVNLKQAVHELIGLLVDLEVLPKT
jgi:hypothetical protein